MGTESSKPEQNNGLWRHIRVTSPRRMVLLGPELPGNEDSWLLHAIAPFSPAPPPNTVSNDVYEPIMSSIKLSNATLSQIGPDCAYPNWYYKAFEDIIKDNADAIFFVMDATGYCEGWKKVGQLLPRYALRLDETEDSVLLFLVTRADREDAKPFEAIEETIHNLLVQHGREDQCHTIEAIDPKTEEGLGSALDWVSEQLNQRKDNHGTRDCAA
ncbi:Hypothetical protein D9617_30g011490 [Elsinoe fawcettii]|nr:Hypothetical protein D9617_30g011490 [Elsinoe fawcettii]